jgi:hypothetical protein
MWLSAIKLAVSAGSKIYANKQKTKMAMSEAVLAAPVMVYKFMDPCRSEHLWYKGYTNI